MRWKFERKKLHEKKKWIDKYLVYIQGNKWPMLFPSSIVFIISGRCACWHVCYSDYKVKIKTFSLTFTWRRQTHSCHEEQVRQRCPRPARWPPHVLHHGQPLRSLAEASDTRFPLAARVITSVYVKFSYLTVTCWHDITTHPCLFLHSKALQ